MTAVNSFIFQYDQDSGFNTIFINNQCFFLHENTMEHIIEEHFTWNELDTKTKFYQGMKPSDLLMLVLAYGEIVEVRGQLYCELHSKGLKIGGGGSSDFGKLSFHIARLVITKENEIKTLFPARCVGLKPFKNCSIFHSCKCVHNLKTTHFLLPL